MRRPITQSTLNERAQVVDKLLHICDHLKRDSQDRQHPWNILYYRDVSGA
jgi:hypothetical protein